MGWRGAVACPDLLATWRENWICFGAVRGCLCRKRIGPMTETSHILCGIEQGTRTRESLGFLPLPESSLSNYSSYSDVSLFHSLGMIVLCKMVAC